MSNEAGTQTEEKAVTFSSYEINKKLDQSANSINSQGQSMLKASHQLLMNNYVRSIKQYLDGFDPSKGTVDQSTSSGIGNQSQDILCKSIVKMKTKLNQLSQSQKIQVLSGLEESSDEESGDEKPSLINDLLV